jgi:hypothetical protein
MSVSPSARRQRRRIRGGDSRHDAGRERTMRAPRLGEEQRNDIGLEGCVPEAAEALGGEPEGVVSMSPLFRQNRKKQPRMSTTGLEIRKKSDWDAVVKPSGAGPHKAGRLGFQSRRRKA